MSYIPVHLDGQTLRHVVEDDPNWPDWAEGNSVCGRSPWPGKWNKAKGGGGMYCVTCLRKVHENG